MEFVSQSVNYL